MRIRELLAVAAIAVIISMVTSGTAVARPSDLAAARAGTAGYHNIHAATHDNYGELRDAAGIACIDKPGVGGMGIHYVNGALVGDASVNAATPELLVYEPTGNGRLRLVAVEYVVFQDAWDKAGNTRPPSLFGQDFTLIGAGNRYGLDPFWELHAWIWQHNQTGMHQDYNARVSCAAA